MGFSFIVEDNNPMNPKKAIQIDEHPVRLSRIATYFLILTINILSTYVAY